MDSLGMIIDVSHVGIRTIDDILATSVNPIIASHSGCRSLCEHTRNLTNAQIISIAQRGGVIGVDYISLGSDFDGGITPPVGLPDDTKFPLLTAALLQKGYSRQDVWKILGENFLRVYRAICH